MADQTGANNPNWKGGLVIGYCLTCHKVTRVKPNQAKAGRGKFCSAKCTNIWHAAARRMKAERLRVPIACAICGKVTKVKPSHVHMGEGTYCSRACMAEGYRRRLKGAANPNYRHGLADTPGMYREGQKRWRAANRDKLRVLSAQTKVRRRNVPGKYTSKDVASLMRQQRAECVLCGCSLKGGYHVDHRIPLARGGHNNVGNLQLLCPSCNIRKSVQFMVELKYGKRPSK